MRFKAMAVALAGGICIVSNASATQWYNYTLSGNDMMTTTGLQIYVGATDNESPRDLGFFDGARKFLPTLDPSADRRTYRNFSSTMNFLNWYGTTDNRLAQFNLWGYGGDQAEGWGEDYQAEAWGYNADSSSAEWDTYMTYDPDATGVVLNWWTSDGWDEGLEIGATDNPTFSFSLGLADDFDDWYGGEDGSLAFWFGGEMLNPLDQVTGKLQGNIVLDGSPVPEPATMLLFGTGIAGLVGLRRKAKK